MTKFYTEVDQILTNLNEELDDNFEDIFKESLLHNDLYDEIKSTLGDKNITIENVDSGGGEDEGSDYFNVYKFTRNDETCYMKVFGYYASHYGTDYEGYGEVEPKERIAYDWHTVL